MSLKKEKKGAFKMILIVITTVMAVIIVVLALRCRKSGSGERFFGLNELRAALGIDPNISPKSLRAIVVGALGYADRVSEDIAEEKRGLNDGIDSASHAVSVCRSNIEEIRRRTEEKIGGINERISSQERRIERSANDLRALENLEARINA